TDVVCCAPRQSTLRRRIGMLKQGAVLNEPAKCLRTLSLLVVVLVFASAPVEAQISRSAVSYLARGNESYTKGDLDAAIADYDAAIAFDPRYALAYLRRGDVHQERADFEAALGDYTKAIEINPRLSAAYNNRGNARQSMGDISKAIEDFNKAI